MITILTHSPSFFSKEYLKSFIKKSIGKTRGPSAVIESLHRGLHTLNVPHQIDPSSSKITGTVHVVSGIEALRFAIARKKKGLITTLIAGPNITISPNQYDSILLDPAIDIVIQPSEWTKNFYISAQPKIKDTLRIWPAGVATPSEKSPRNNNHVIIYQKNASPALLTSIETALTQRNILYTTLTYGNFKRDDFYNLLLKSDAMIYLSASESQGIALQEAWIRDVPTLAWKTGTWKNGDYSWQDPKISAPYLTEETGMFFNEENLDADIDRFMTTRASYVPRQYASTHFTDVVCTQNYLDILRKTGVLI